MFSRHDLSLLTELTDGRFKILSANCHDVTLQSFTTGHEWVIMTDYGNSRCRLRHRHSRNVPFHEQRGRYDSMNGAFAYIEIHDIWFAAKEKARRNALPFRSVVMR